LVRWFFGLSVNSVFKGLIRQYVPSPKENSLPITYMPSLAMRLDLAVLPIINWI